MSVDLDLSDLYDVCCLWLITEVIKGLEAADDVMATMLLLGYNANVFLN